jgi:eukaryotic-like serine/threonine-protein kinase
VTVAATLLDGRYSLDEQIGAGGFCEVWRASDTVLTRPVAVKLLHAGYAHQPEARARFKAEARHAGALSHKNIACVYDYGEPAPEQGWSLLCNGVVIFEDTGELLPGGAFIAPHRPTDLAAFDRPASVAPGHGRQAPAALSVIGDISQSHPAFLV